MTSRTVGALLFLALVAGCASRVPGVAISGFRTGIDTLLATRVLAPDRNLRVDEIARTESSSYHLGQVRIAEPAHHHATHDMTVLVLRGRGVLALGAIRVPLEAGDAAVVPRGEVHRFVNAGEEPAVALVVFTPPLDAPDSVPDDDR